MLAEEHQFLWEGEADTWGKRLAKAYYDKLFKEYTICDLSRYKENMVALRWRTEQEVISGKGQFVCGSKRCSEQSNLESWEVNFAYVERGEKKSALVKLRLCPSCSHKLNYHHKKRRWKRRGGGMEDKSVGRKKHKQKKRKKESRESGRGYHSSSSSSDSEGECGCVRMWMGGWVGVFVCVDVYYCIMLVKYRNWSPITLGYSILPSLLIHGF